MENVLKDISPVIQMIIVMAVTGRVAQRIIGKEEKKDGKVFH